MRVAGSQIQEIIRKLRYNLQGFDFGRINSMINHDIPGFIAETPQEIWVHRSDISEVTAKTGRRPIGLTLHQDEIDRNTPEYWYLLYLEVAALQTSKGIKSTQELVDYRKQNGVAEDNAPDAIAYFPNMVDTQKYWEKILAFTTPNIPQYAEEFILHAGHQHEVGDRVRIDKDWLHGTGKWKGDFQSPPTHPEQFEYLINRVGTVTWAEEPDWTGIQEITIDIDKDNLHWGGNRWVPAAGMSTYAEEFVLHAEQWEPISHLDINAGDTIKTSQMDGEYILYGIIKKIGYCTEVTHPGGVKRERKYPCDFIAHWNDEERITHLQVLESNDKLQHRKFWRKAPAVPQFSEEFILHSPESPDAEGRKLRYIREDDEWHFEIWENPDDTAHLKRIKCPEGIKPSEWDSADRTPDEWLAIQRSRNLYKPYPPIRIPEFSREFKLHAHDDGCVFDFMVPKSFFKYSDDAQNLRSIIEHLTLITKGIKSISGSYATVDPATFDYVSFQDDCYHVGGDITWGYPAFPEYKQKSKFTYTIKVGPKSSIPEFAPEFKLNAPIESSDIDSSVEDGAKRFKLNAVPERMQITLTKKNKTKSIMGYDIYGETPARQEVGKTVQKLIKNKENGRIEMDLSTKDKAIVDVKIEKAQSISEYTPEFVLHAPESRCWPYTSFDKVKIRDIVHVSFEPHWGVVVGTGFIDFGDPHGPEGEDDAVWMIMADTQEHAIEFYHDDPSIEYATYTNYHNSDTIQYCGTIDNPGLRVPKFAKEFVLSADDSEDNRYMNVDLQLAKDLRFGEILYHKSWTNIDKTPQRWKVTSVKTWKRDPSRVLIGLKRGMNEYDKIDETQIGNYVIHLYDYEKHYPDTIPEYAPEFILHGNDNVPAWASSEDESTSDIQRILHSNDDVDDIWRMAESLAENAKIDLNFDSHENLVISSHDKQSAQLIFVNSYGDDINVMFDTAARAAKYISDVLNHKYENRILFSYDLNERRGPNKKITDGFKIHYEYEGVRSYEPEFKLASSDFVLNCEACFNNGTENPAKYFAPQVNAVIPGGYRWMPICEDHREDWWISGDEKRPPFYMIEHPEHVREYVEEFILHAPMKQYKFTYNEHRYEANEDSTYIDKHEVMINARNVHDAYIEFVDKLLPSEVDKERLGIRGTLSELIELIDAKFDRGWDNIRERITNIRVKEVSAIPEFTPEFKLQSEDDNMTKKDIPMGEPIEEDIEIIDEDEEEQFDDLFRQMQDESAAKAKHRNTAWMVVGAAAGLAASVGIFAWLANTKPTPPDCPKGEHWDHSVKKCIKNEEES